MPQQTVVTAARLSRAIPDPVADTRPAEAENRSRNHPVVTSPGVQMEPLELTFGERQPLGVRIAAALEGYFENEVELGRLVAAGELFRKLSQENPLGCCRLLQAVDTDERFRFFVRLDEEGASDPVIYEAGVCKGGLLSATQDRTLYTSGAFSEFTLEVERFALTDLLPPRPKDAIDEALMVTQLAVHAGVGFADTIVTFDRLLGRMKVADTLDCRDIRAQCVTLISQIETIEGLGQASARWVLSHAHDNGAKLAGALWRHDAKNVLAVARSPIEALDDLVRSYPDDLGSMGPEFVRSSIEPLASFRLCILAMAELCKIDGVPNWIDGKTFELFAGHQSVQRAAGGIFVGRGNINGDTKIPVLPLLCMMQAANNLTQHGSGQGCVILDRVGKHYEVVVRDFGKGYVNKDGSPMSAQQIRQTFSGYSTKTSSDGGTGGKVIRHVAETIDVISVVDGKKTFAPDPLSSAPIDIHFRDNGSVAVYRIPVGDTEAEREIRAVRRNLQDEQEVRKAENPQSPSGAVESGKLSLATFRQLEQPWLKTAY